MDINSYENVYFIGVGGIGMSALARYFKSIGKKVQGYDKTKTKLTQILQEEGIEISYEDIVSQHILELQRETTLVVYTPAIKKLKILDYFQKENFPVLKRAKVLGLITQKTQCIAVAGTHGKTTTSSLVAHLCKEINLPFSAFLGGISENFKSNFLFNGDKYSVVEADEYDKSFLNLFPDWAIVTSMDADHLDIYGNQETIEKGFNDFINLIPNEKHLFVRKGLEVDRNVFTYAVNEEADYYSDNLKMNKGQFTFDFYTLDRKKYTFQWEIPGIHNIENATAALALLTNLGTDISLLQEALPKFKGIKRRYTKHEFSNGKIYIDDYAHHPTELNAVISSVKAFYPNKKILLVFQPHLFSRTRDFVDDFAKKLALVDELLLLDIYPARELQEDYPEVNSQWLLERVEMENKDQTSLENVLKKLQTKNFDVLLTVGAGSVDLLSDPICEWLSTKK